MLNQNSKRKAREKFTKTKSKIYLRHKLVNHLIFLVSFFGHKIKTKIGKTRNPLDYKNYVRLFKQIETMEVQIVSEFCSKLRLFCNVCVRVETADTFSKMAAGSESQAVAGGGSTQGVGRAVAHFLLRNKPN